MSVQITCSEEQAKTIALALEVLTRAQLDQYSIIKELVPPCNRLDYHTHNILSAIRHFNFVDSGRERMGCVDETHINLSKKDNVIVSKINDAVVDS